MNKETFLEELRGYLRILEDQEQEDILAEYAQHIDMKLLPSAYFALTPIEQGYLLQGGGYGHGIGMSQNGSNGMAKAGMNYMEILMKFYQGITIENIYNGE